MRAPSRLHCYAVGTSLVPINVRKANLSHRTELGHEAIGEITMLKSKRRYTGLIAGMVFGLLACAAVLVNPDGSVTQTYIVQGHELTTLKAAVATVGGEITHELGIINAVAVKLSAAQLRALKGRDEIRRIYADAAVEISGKGGNGDGGGKGGNIDSTYVPTMTGAADLHAEGTDGTGVTVAVIDTGAWSDYGITKNPLNEPRMVAQYDAIQDKTSVSDGYGHGTHVTSIAVSSRDRKSVV